MAEIACVAEVTEPGIWGGLYNTLRQAGHHITFVWETPDMSSELLRLMRGESEEVTPEIIIVYGQSRIYEPLIAEGLEGCDIPLIFIWTGTDQFKPQPRDGVHLFRGTTLFEPAELVGLVEEVLGSQ